MHEQQAQQTQQTQRTKTSVGKARPDLLEEGFPHALRLVQAVLEYGALKYRDHGWRDVPDACMHYSRAARRHRQARDLVLDHRRGYCAVYEAHDEESGLPHIAHEITNLLIVLEAGLLSAPEPNALLQRLLDKTKEPPRAPRRVT